MLRVAYFFDCLSSSSAKPIERIEAIIYIFKLDLEDERQKAGFSILPPLFNSLRAIKNQEPRTVYAENVCIGHRRSMITKRGGRNEKIQLFVVRPLNLIKKIYNSLYSLNSQ